MSAMPAECFTNDFQVLVIRQRSHLQAAINLLVYQGKGLLVFKFSFSTFQSWTWLFGGWNCVRRTPHKQGYSNNQQKEESELWCCHDCPVEDSGGEIWCYKVTSIKMWYQPWTPLKPCQNLPQLYFVILVYDATGDQGFKHCQSDHVIIET